jgi:hypothetical protein
MIQRIQSLYLFISSVITSFLIFTPLASFKLQDQIIGELYSYCIKNTAVSNVQIKFNPVLLIVLVVVSVMLGLFTIFLFKKRKLQIWLNVLNILILLAIITLIVYYCISISVNNNASINYYIQSILPFISIILIFLSIKRIHKDEKLIRSLDRVR